MASVKVLEHCPLSKGLKVPPPDIFDAQGWRQRRLHALLSDYCRRYFLLGAYLRLDAVAVRAPPQQLSSCLTSAGLPPFPAATICRSRMCVRGAPARFAESMLLPPSSLSPLPALLRCVDRYPPRLREEELWRLWYSLRQYVTRYVQPPAKLCLNDGL